MSKRKHAWKWNQRFDRAIKHKNYKNSMFYKPPYISFKKTLCLQNLCLQLR